MKITVRYFAALRDQRGLSQEAVDCEELTAGELVVRLLKINAMPISRTLVRCAVNQQFVDDDHRLCDGDEVSLIPPVAGG